MKKIIIFLCLILSILCLSECGKNNATANVYIQIGASEEFSEEEIKEAIELVKRKFNFQDCKLTKLWYEEEKADQIRESYLNYGRGAINGVKKENVIVILSEFEVSKFGKNPVLNHGATYSNYGWTLIRSGEKSQWTIDDQGY